MSIEIFRDRKLIIATKHDKEKVIAPLLEKSIGVNCFTNKNFDTDTFGTFTGEIERKLDPINTLRQKCLSAMELSNCDLGIASEGSFGPHPSLFFVSADDEFLILIDKKNNLEVIVRELSTETNFNGSEIKNEQDLFAFADKVKFPSHGVILRRSKSDNSSIIKDISSVQELKSAFQLLQQTYNTVYAETDMRAMRNPSRMQVIEKATRRLVEKINSCCPKCETPGFGVTDYIRGLPCELCGAATQSIKSTIYNCNKCDFQQILAIPNKLFESAQFCDYCNP